MTRGNGLIIRFIARIQTGNSLMSSTGLMVILNQWGELRL